MPEPYMMYFTRPPRKDVFDAPIVMQSSGAPLQLPALMTPPALCLSRWRRISTTLCSLLPWRPAPQPVLKISPALMQTTLLPQHSSFYVSLYIYISLARRRVGVLYFEECSAVASADTDSYSLLRMDG